MATEAYHPNSNVTAFVGDSDVNRPCTRTDEEHSKTFLQTGYIHMNTDIGEMIMPKYWIVSDEVIEALEQWKDEKIRRCIWGTGAIQ
jgi:hypothetical protein